MSNPDKVRPAEAAKVIVVDISTGQVNKILPPSFVANYVRVQVVGANAEVAFSKTTDSAPTLSISPTAAADVDGVAQPSSGAGDYFADGAVEHFDLSLLGMAHKVNTGLTHGGINGVRLSVIASATGKLRIRVS